MANVLGPQGFKQASYTAGLAQNFGLMPAKMAYNASACYKGDPLILSGGKAAVATVTGGTGAAVLGIADTFSWVSIAQNRRVWQNYYPGSDSVGNVDIDVLINCNPDALFQVQSNAGPALQADVGSFFNFASGTGNTSSGQSGFSLDYSTKNSTKGTLPFVLQSIVQQPVSDPTTQYNLVIVGFANLTPF